MKREDSSLDSKLSDLIPEIEIDNRWEESSPLKVVHLLEHTAGFDDMHFNEFYTPGGKRMLTFHALSVNPSSRIVRWEPGTRTAYSNPGYAVTGYLLEKFSGQSFEDYLTNLICVSTGMQESYFRFDDIPQHERPLGYVYQDDSVKSVEYRELLYRWTGALNTSAHDMAKFVMLLLNKGLTADSIRIIQPEMIDRMEQTKTSCAGQHGLNVGYGLATQISVKGIGPSISHSGGIEGFVSKYRYFRAAEMGFVFLLDIESAEAYHGLDSLLQAWIQEYSQYAEEAAPALSLDLEDEFTGYYVSANPRNAMFRGMTRLMNGISIFEKNDTLYSKQFMQTPKGMIQISQNIFRYDGYVGGHLLFRTTKQVSRPLLMLIWRKSTMKSRLHLHIMP